MKCFDVRQAIPEYIVGNFSITTTSFAGININSDSNGIIFLNNTQSFITINECLFKHCYSNLRQGVLVVHNGYFFTLQKTIFHENYALDMPDFCIMSSSSYHLNDFISEENSFRSSNSAGIQNYVGSMNALHITKQNFTGLKAHSRNNGIGILIKGYQAKISNCIFNDCTGGRWILDVFSGQDKPLQLENCAFTNCQCQYFAGVNLNENNSDHSISKIFSVNCVFKANVIDHWMSEYFNMLHFDKCFFDSSAPEFGTISNQNPLSSIPLTYQILASIKCELNLISAAKYKLNNFVCFCLIHLIEGGKLTC